MDALTPEEEAQVDHVEAAVSELDAFMASAKASVDIDRAREKLREARMWFLEALVNG